MKKAASPGKGTSLVGPSAAESEVRARAYQLFEARGREDGHDLEDWLRAEDEIAGRKTRLAASGNHSLQAVLTAINARAEKQERGRYNRESRRRHV